jgi:hypothetical protein
MSYNASGPIHMYDEGAYIRVTNDSSSTVVNYVKATLLIQRDSDCRFFFKNDSFITYYNYTDVSTPYSSSIDDLIAQIKSWNTQSSFSGSVSIDNSNLPVTITNSSIATTLPISITDQFKRLKVSATPTTLLNISSIYDKTPTQISEWYSNDTSSSNDFVKGVVSMPLTTAEGSHIIRQSKIYASYVHGSTSTAVVSARLINDVSLPGVLARVGVFDESSLYTGAQPVGNGMYFEWSTNYGLNVVYRTNFSGSMIDYRVPQGDWNIDLIFFSFDCYFYIEVTNVTKVT